MSEQREIRVPMPADVDRPDRIAFGLTMRQCLILGGVAAGLWAAYQVLGHVVPALVALAVAIPVMGLAIVITLGRRAG
ncbi:PrgI family protein [Fodinicola feengrottensis]|uniref:PrgI family protein n=1 Tax=Fodinicola feengrottensis TaxID=435914 RepID=UPI0013D5D4C8|nr:PrgI family protein [Fodinicola feengrottensis]